eukprot:3710642-Rhodomonas_salina.1
MNTPPALFHTKLAAYPQTTPRKTNIVLPEPQRFQRVWPYPKTTCMSRGVTLGSQRSTSSAQTRRTVAGQTTRSGHALSAAVTARA